MTCIKPGCGNRQCYICSKSCDYDHFTKSGCPLHDSVGNDVETRHLKEAQEAGEAVRKRLLEENADMTEEELRIKLPEDPIAGTKKSAKPRAPRHRNGARANPVPAPPLRPLANPPPLPLNGQRIYDKLAGQQGEPVLLLHDHYAIQQYQQGLQFAGAGSQQQEYPFQFFQEQQQNPAQQPPAQVTQVSRQHAAKSKPPHRAHERFRAQRRELVPGPEAVLHPPGEALQLTQTPPDQAPCRAPDEWNTSLQALEQQNAALQAALRDSGRALDRFQTSAGQPMRRAPGVAVALERLHDKGPAVAAASRSPGSALGHVHARPATNNTPKTGTLESNHEHQNTDGNASPVAEALKEMHQTKSQYIMEVRMRLTTALHPYIDEITKQVGNHIQAAWIGPMPPHLAASTRQPITREIWKGVPQLVERELEEIDRVVRVSHWEHLYSAEALSSGQFRHHGEIAAPETADEYVTLHMIIRSRDRRAPPHHEELARETHSRVIESMGIRQPPPRVAPFHYYGHPDRRPLNGQLGTAERIQKYLERRHARVSRDLARGKALQAVEGDNGPDTASRTARENPAQPPAPAAMGLETEGM